MSLLLIALMHFDIEAGNAAERLNEWATASGMSVTSAYNTTAPLTTSAVIGDYEPLQALTLMLSGTGLQFGMVNASFVTIFTPDAATRPVRTTSPDEVQSVMEYCSVGWLEDEEVREFFGQEAVHHRWCCTAYRDGDGEALWWGQDTREKSDALVCLSLD